MLRCGILTSGGNDVVHSPSPEACAEPERDRQIHRRLAADSKRASPCHIERRHVWGLTRGVSFRNARYDPGVARPRQPDASGPRKCLALLRIEFSEPPGTPLPYTRARKYPVLLGLERA